VAETHLFANVAGEVLPTVARGEGVWLVDTEGRRYLDGCSGAMTANIGHGNVEIADAIAAQARTIAFTARSFFTSEPAEELAALLAARAPEGLDRVFFVSSGSEAVETASKLALQYWRERGRPEKTELISRHTSYHGSTMGALSLSGHPVRRRAWTDVVRPYPRVVAPSCYRCPFDLTFPTCELACANDVARAFREVGPDRVAAVVVEPIVGAAGGAINPPDGYYERVAELCRANDVLLIADEVLTGVHRTGPFLALTHWGVTADLVALGKGLAAGYTPLSAVLISDRVADAITNGSGVFVHGHTHASNPLSAATGLAVLRWCDANGVFERVPVRGAQLGTALSELRQRHQIVGDVRGRGLLWGVELVADRDTKARLPGGAASAVECARRQGLLIYPAGDGTLDAFLVAPPLTISESDIEELARRLDAALDDLAAKSQ
jgi:adenosylmethionine-8-amino-7-oxononanoate aminotransferase